MGILDMRTYFYFGADFGYVHLDHRKEYGINKLYAIHDPCINRLYNVMAPTDAHKYLY